MKFQMQNIYKHNFEAAREIEKRNEYIVYFYRLFGHVKFNDFSLSIGDSRVSFGNGLLPKKTYKNCMGKEQTAGNETDFFLNCTTRSPPIREKLPDKFI